MEKITVNDAQFATEQQGYGNALVFLHAGVADRRMWQPQMDAFGKDFQLIAYDRREFGETESADIPFSHVADLQALLDHFSISAAHLVGCSQGGRIAIDFALSFPERVKSLTLIAPAVSGAPKPESFPDEVGARLDALDEADEADDLEQVNKIEAQIWLDGALGKIGRIDGNLRELFLKMNGNALQMPEMTQEVEPASAYERVAELSQSTLIIWGDLDFPHVQERCRHLAATIPNARAIEIQEAAHLVSLEKFEDVNLLLRNFLSSLR